MNQSALILSDGKPGHFHQSIALCQHLGLPHKICEVAFPSRIHRLLSHAFDACGVYSTFPFRTQRTPSNADIVISTGSRTYYANKVTAKKLGAKSVAILAPRGYQWNFDALLIPGYDHPPKQNNVIQLPINISYMAPELIEEKVNEFRQRHEPKTAQVHKVSILLGGDNKAGRMNPQEISHQLNQIQQKHPDSEIWVTTSRRTPQDVEADLRNRNFAYRHLYSEEPYNPIPAFIHLCDHLYVSTDSTSMLSECVSNGKAKVSLIETTCSAKHKALASNLKQLNLIDTDRKIDISEYLQKLNHLLQPDA